MTPEALDGWRDALEAALTARADVDDGAHDIGHVRRVWRNCLAIAGDEPAAPDMETLVAAAHLHDLVNPPKNDPDRAQASRRSAAAARDLLAALSFPAEKLDAVAHAIEAHSFSAGVEPQTLEARVLQDADRLDALGAVGLARMFYIAGRLGSALADPDDLLGAARPLDDARFALDHLQTKLFPIAATMKTSGGRRLAEARVALMRRFQSAFLEENGASSARASA